MLAKLLQFSMYTYVSAGSYVTHLLLGHRGRVDSLHWKNDITEDARSWEQNLRLGPRNFLGNNEQFREQLRKTLSITLGVFGKCRRFLFVIFL